MRAARVVDESAQSVRRLDSESEACQDEVVGC